MKNHYYDFSLLSQYMTVLKEKLRIAVIYGGDKTCADSVIYKTHNPRPWKSYESVATDIQQTLIEEGFKEVILLPENMALGENLKKYGIHFGWLNTGGVQGYNPTAHAASMLEMMGMPYVGHNPLNSSTLDNKHYFKRELMTADIKTAPFITWDSSLGILSPKQNSSFQSAFNGYEGPFTVKPVTGRASLNISVVDKKEDLSLAVADLHSITHNHVLIEKYLPGREFCVGVAGPVVNNGTGELIKKSSSFVFSEVERVLGKDERIFTSMDKKAITKDRLKLVTEESDPDLKKQLKEIAERTYQNFNLKSLVRLDIRADEKGELFVLEANPKPDLKKPDGSIVSIVTMGLEEHNMDYGDLIYSLLADRLDYMFTHRIDTIEHIVDLLH